MVARRKLQSSARAVPSSAESFSPSARPRRHKKTRSQSPANAGKGRLRFCRQFESSFQANRPTLYTSHCARLRFCRQFESSFQENRPILYTSYCASMRRNIIPMARHTTTNCRRCQFFFYCVGFIGLCAVIWYIFSVCYLYGTIMALLAPAMEGTGWCNATPKILPTRNGLS
jgi:hypothetical protein